MPSRAAYQWIRSPSGWTKPVVAAVQVEDGVPEEQEEYDAFEIEEAIGRAEMPFDDIWTPNKVVPLGAQAQVDKTAEEWASLWSEAAEYEIGLEELGESTLPP